ncbi:tRNA (adenine(22)-N(1))-methyltransferase TrmK [Metabacillus herbersteinensis]|uniref:tRNA (Adenine(22)-N(1))-methyltransferase TrmK n=1 Tax=Metabacillus herbersteinensis TaxID=283816 RepID=A0ABV6G8M3_9BACI
MNELKLSKRLETVANFIPKDAIVADIGSDHAYLPCYAVLNGIAKSAIVGEITEGPFQSSKKQVQKSELADSVIVRKGDGLEVLRKGEVTCITIAGMGGALIHKILEEGKEKLEGVVRLILQPNINASVIRSWLLENEWQLIAEEILEEDDKIYEILVADRGDPKIPYHETSLDAGLLFGPFLMKDQQNPFKKKWLQECEHWKTIVEKLNQAANTPENNRKRNELIHQIELAKEVLK